MPIPTDRDSSYPHIEGPEAQKDVNKDQVYFSSRYNMCFVWNEFHTIPKYFDEIKDRHTMLVLIYNQQIANNW
jgi:hypothetical protein